MTRRATLYPLEVRSSVGVKRWVASALGVLAAASLCACGPSTRRSLKDPAPQMTYEDSCDLQSYFDQRRTAFLEAPVADDEKVSVNEKGVTTGSGGYRLKDPLARRRFARMLREEYSGIEPKVLEAIEKDDADVRVRVRWWDTGQMRRLHPDEGAIVIESGAGKLEVPPNMCVSDLLFGQKVYEMRARYLRREVDIATDKPLSP